MTDETRLDKWYQRYCERYGLPYSRAEWKRKRAGAQDYETERQMRKRFAKTVPKPRELPKRPTVPANEWVSKSGVVRKVVPGLDPKDCPLVKQ